MNATSSDAKPSKGKRIFKKIIKIFAWIIGVVLGLVLLVFALLFLPPVQNYLTGKAETFLADKLDTKVKVGAIRLSLPLGVTLKEFYVEDKQADTLLFSNYLNADVNAFALLKKTLQITEIELEGVRANVWIDEDSVSNLDFLVAAFATTDSVQTSSDQTATQVAAKDSTGGGFVISLGGADLKDIHLNYDDRYNGNDVKLNLGRLKIDVNDFDLQKLHFGVKKLSLEETDIRFVQTKLPPEKPEKPDTTDGIGFQIDVNKIELTKINAFYQSNVSGQQVDLKLGELFINAKQTNLGTQKIVIQDVALNDTYVAYKMGLEKTGLDSAMIKAGEAIAKETAEVAGTEVDEGKPWIVEVKNLALDNNEVLFENVQLEKQAYGFDPNHIHFEKIAFEVQNFKFYPSLISAVVQHAHATDKRQQFEIKDLKGVIQLDSVGVGVSNLKIQTGRSTIGQKALLGAPLAKLATQWQTAKLDLNLDGTEIALADVFYFAPDLAQKISLGRNTTEKIYLNGKASGKTNDLTLQNFEIKGLTNTQIKLSGKVKGLPDIENLFVDANLQPFQTSRQDLNKIIPKGTLPNGFDYPRQILVRASAKGTMQDLFVRLFADLDETKIELGGTVKNPTNPDKLYLDIATKQFLVYLNDVKNWIPDTLLPQNLTLPPKIEGDIAFTGFLNDFTTNTKLNTSLGTVSLEGTLKNLMDKQAIPQYNAKAIVSEVELGNILQDTTLGVVSLNLKAEGSGFEPEQIKANVSGVVDKFEYQSYVYQNLQLSGKVNGYSYDGMVSMNDKNLDFKFNGNVAWDTIRPKFIVNLDLKKADLQALNLYKEPLTLGLDLKANIAGKDLDNLKGDLNIKNVDVYTKNRNFHVDSAAFISISQKGETNIDLKSDIVSAHIEGNLDFSTFVTTIKNHVNTYIEIDPIQPDKQIGSQQMDFSIQIHRSELITALVPNLTRFDPAYFKGKYRSDSKKLELVGVFPRIFYNQIDLDSLKINVDSDTEKLTYSISVAEVESSAYQFEQPSISGKVANNKADLNIIVRDEKSKPRFEIGAFLLRPDTTKFIVSLEEQQILNYTKWQVRPNNEIILGENLAIRNFELSNANQIFTVQTTNNDQDLNANFTNFDMATLTNIASPNDTTQLAGGRLNGKVKLQNFATELQFLADLTIDKLVVLNSQLGNLTIYADNKTAGNRYDVNIKLTGANQFALTGYYNAAKEASDALNMDLNITKLDLTSLQNLTMGNLRDAKGIISGKLDVTGTTTNPTVIGKLNFSDTEFFLTSLGAFLQIPNEQIIFDKRGIDFDNFTILDRSKNKLAVNGRINTTDFTTFNFDLNVEGNRFNFVDSNKDNGNDMFYGKGIANVDVNVGGTLTALVIDADVDVLEGTDLTYKLPEPELATIEKEGIVEFVDRPFGSDTLISLTPQNPSDTTEYAQNMDIRATININPEAKIKVEIDAANQLEVQGGGDLNFNLNPSGEMSITGRYEITDGMYNLNFYNLAKRKFKIQKGSYLVFYGDIMDIEANLNAIYEVEAPPYELMVNQLGNVSEQELNRYKQELPFEVILKMNGEILNPSINFDIDMDENSKGALGGTVNTRLQLLNRQESELNKQVFALLILGGFISENPLDRAQGEMGFAERTARNTVSGLLTDQLNKLADQNLKGFDLSFDLESYEDYSTGESQSRTELGINLSKSFLNDRLTFQVGSSVDLEGKAAQQQQAQGLSGLTGNVIISYLLTEDGRYKVQIFRENNYAGVIDGQLTETGVSIIFVREYDELSELFKKDKEEKRIKRSKSQEQNEKEAQTDEQPEKEEDIQSFLQKAKRREEETKI